MGPRARQAIAITAAVLTLATAASLIGYVLHGTPDEQDHRAQVVGTILATLLVVPTAIAWTWRWVADHRHHPAPDDPEHAVTTTSPGRTVEISGTWHAAWQSYKDGTEVIAVQPVRVTQTNDLLALETIARGRPVEDGGYHWRGELRLWDNEILIGWYTSTDSSVRSKGTLYFVLHPQGRRMTGRWVGLSYDGRTITGLGAMARTDHEARQAVTRHHPQRPDSSD